MSPEEAAEKMREIFSYSPSDRQGIAYASEKTHRQGDDLMLKILRFFGYGEAADIFQNADKWYS